MFVKAYFAEVDDGQLDCFAELFDERKVVSGGEDALGFGPGGEEVQSEGEKGFGGDGVGVGGVGQLVCAAVMKADGGVEAWNGVGLVDDALRNFEVCVP